MGSGRLYVRRLLPYAVAVVAGLAVITAAYVIVPPGPQAGACIPLEVSSSTEKDVLVAQLAERYNSSGRRFNGRCAEVTVHGLTSGKAMDALAAGWARRQPTVPQPQVWLPTSTLWTGQLELGNVSALRPLPASGRYPSVANSPLVVAMPQQKAEVLRQRGELGWGDMLGLSGQDGWVAFGRPEWGRFTFGKDNPHMSTSGLAATIATYYAAINRASDLTDTDLTNPVVTRFVRSIEANVSHYSDDVVDLLRNLAEADRAETPIDLSAIVMQEELVYLYNQGELSPTRGDKPRVPLVALYPKEGTLNLDHPYVVLASASAGQREAAADFLDFLQAAAQQHSFSDLGFRDHQRVASAALVASVRGPATDTLVYFEPPGPTVVKEILTGWGTLRKKANIIIAVDTSGSMKNRIEEQTRLQVATSAAAKGVGLLNSEDRVALWSFSSETAQRPKAPYSQELPLAGFDKTTFTKKISGLHAEGATALYATVRAAHRYLLEHYDPNRINAVVVLTDGKNEYSKDNDLAALLRDIALDPDRPVKIFCIAFDQQSEFVPLDRIARASLGKAFDARDPAKIDEAFVKLLSSF